MGKARILIAEDERITALDIERSLHRAGYEVVDTVVSGPDAISSSLRLKPDAVLMDIFLDGEMDGISAAAQIRDRLGIPVIFLTAHADDRTIERAQVTEPDGYLLKPFQDGELHAALQMALYRKRAAVKRNRRPQTFEFPINGKAAVLGEREIASFLKSLDFFSSLAPDELDLFASACEARHVPAGEDLIRAGEENPGAFIVLRGRVSMISTSRDGRQFTVEVLPPGDILGLVSAVEADPAPLTARAQIGSDVLSIPKSTFRLLLESRPELARRFSEFLLLRLRRSHELARAMAHDQVPSRVAAALLSLIPEGSDAECCVQVTRQELADITGCAVETVIRATREFEREGILRLGQRRKITVTNRAKLQALAAEQ